jgi:hypothetical protein
MARHPPPLDHGSVGATLYEIRVKGRIGGSVLARFEGFEADVEPAETILTGAIPDQAALHGLLEQIHELGLELIEVRRVDEDIARD